MAKILFLVEISMIDGKVYYFMRLFFGKVYVCRLEFKGKVPISGKVILESSKEKCMLKRKIQKEIADYLDNGSDKILVLDGARQIGKSFIIRYEGQKRFKNYIEIDLYEDKNGEKIFEGTRNRQGLGNIRLNSSIL